MEEFRPVVVDAMVFRCLSTGIVRFEEFETTPELGCRMNDRSRQAFLAAYERRMLTLFTHEPGGRVSTGPARTAGQNPRTRTTGS